MKFGNIFIIFATCHKFTSKALTVSMVCLLRLSYQAYGDVCHYLRFPDRKLSDYEK